MANTPRRPRKFSFEEAWCDEDECDARVRKAWDTNNARSGLPLFLESLWRCKNSLGSWGLDKKAT